MLIILIPVLPEFCWEDPCVRDLLGHVEHGEGSRIVQDQEAERLVSPETN